MSTLQTLRSNLRTEIRTDPNGRIWSDATLNRNLVEAVNTIQQDGSFDWFFNDGLETTVSVVGQAEYDLPSDFARLELRGIKYDGYMLNKKDYRVVFDEYDLTSQGTPSIYYLRGTKFGVNPLPSSIKTISYLYRAKLPEMVDDTDDSGMPSDFDEAIISYAEYLCWNDLQGGQAGKAVQALGKYNLTMEGLYAQYLGRRDEADFGWSWNTINPST